MHNGKREITSNSITLEHEDSEDTKENLTPRVNVICSLMKGKAVLYDILCRKDPFGHIECPSDLRVGKIVIIALNSEETYLMGGFSNEKYYGINYVYEV